MNPRRSSTMFRPRTWRIPVFLTLFSCLAGLHCLPAKAFDPSKVWDGLYLNGTNVQEQLYTPLVLARNGELLDPFVLVRDQGMVALQAGMAKEWRVVPAFLYSGCPLQFELAELSPLVSDVPTVSVSRFYDTRLCAIEHGVALENLTKQRSERASNAFPTFFLRQPETIPPSGPLFIYGVPGMLTGDRHRPVMPDSSRKLGGIPSPVNGLVSRMHYMMLPIVQPDFRSLAQKESRLKDYRYKVSVLDAAHRGTDLALNEALIREAEKTARSVLWPRYWPRLEVALGSRFGGLETSFFELAFLHGIDLENQRSFDYIGVARIGARTVKGQERAVDVVFSWRKGDGSIGILRASDEALFDEPQGWFHESNPALFSPKLAVSGFIDLDKDGRPEVITSLVRPFARIVEAGGAREQSIALRDSAIHAFEAGKWREVFRTRPIENRNISYNFKNPEIRRFGE